MAYLMEKETTESVKVTLTREEVMSYAMKLAQATKDLEELEARKASVVAEIKSLMSREEANVQMFSSRVRDGYEYREMACVWIVDDPDPRKPFPDAKQLIRKDTGEVVKSVGMTVEEIRDLKQKKLSFQTDPNKTVVMNPKGKGPNDGKKGGK